MSGAMDETPIRILVIEDDAELRGVLVTVLETEGYQVTAAEDGLRAVQAAQQAGFDLVVADIRMQGMDGLEALEAIQNQQPDVRSLVVTGYSTEGDSIRAIRLGVSEYLTKPFRLESFLDAINAIVAKRRQALERRAERDRLRSTLLWATRLVASYADRYAHGERASLLETAELACRVARRMGFSQIAQEQVQLATLLVGLDVNLSAALAPGELVPSVPPAIVAILANLEERWDGQGGPAGLSGEQIPAESRLVAAVLATRTSSLQALGAADPGRFDPAVLQALTEPDQAADQPVGLHPSHRRGLLSLARAFEEVGNVAAAAEAYRAVTRHGPACREQVEGLVGLFRMETGAAARDLAEKALHQAEQVGPWTLSWAALQLGLAARRTYPDDAARWVRLAGRLCAQMDDVRGQAQAALALAAICPEVGQESLHSAAAVLLRAENRSTLTGLVEGILPYLLRQQALSEPLARLARKSMREVPGAVRRLIRQGELPCQSRLHALELLKAMGADAPVAALEALSQDLEPEVQRAASLQLQASHSSHGAPLLRIFSLGPFEVFRGDERVREDEWKTQKNKYLLALLASLNGQPMAQQSILQLFWPEDPEKGKQSLYWATAVLRQVLASFHPDFKKTVVRRSQCLSLNPEVARWHDLEEVQRVAALSKERLSRGEWQGHRSLLELYRGPYLEGYHQDWVEPMRTRISREVGTALLGVAELALSQSQHQTALEFASRLVDIEPLNTEAGLAFMKALSGLGRYDQVVSYYRGLRRQLTYQDRQPPIAMVETYERAKLSV